MYYINFHTPTDTIYKIGLTNDFKTLKIRIKTIRKHFNTRKVNIINLFQGSLKKLSEIELKLVHFEDFKQYKYKKKNTNKEHGHTECFTNDISNQLCFVEATKGLTTIQISQDYKTTKESPEAQ